MSEEREKDTYNSISALSKGLYKDKGSKFLSFAIPVSCEDDIRKEIDALACVSGDVVYGICHVCGVSAETNALISSIIVVVTRCLAVKFHWHLPVVKGENTQS